MIKSIVTLFVAFLWGYATANIGIDVPPNTVNTFEPEAYLGRWYQMYASLIPTLTYEKDGYCIVADYSNPTVGGSKVSWDLVNYLKYVVRPKLLIIRKPLYLQYITVHFYF